ncbi:cytochrome c oxidase assembly protein [Actinoplanes sp. NPDC049802]|uniref:cytochrome c oxidase assembly protein n=1 Tax=Actinoplanes sp. NPDC049802 TaxID=3154742 RepID=UPI003408FB29
MTAPRIACLAAGLATAAAAVTGPLAGAAHHDFTAHMTGHLLLGMIAPLLLVLAAPVTMVLRALPVGAARRLTRFLNSRPVRMVTHPVPAAALNAGGLWLLYTTGLHHAIGSHPAVHFHVLASGYLFTAAVIGVDPAPHRPGHPVRAAALIGFLAAHAVLAKHLYGHPPPGVPMDEARAGAELMYYGGDLADLVLIVVFCHQWYRAAGARWRLPAELRTAGTTAERHNGW